MSDKMLGVDLSSWNGTVNFDKIYDYGVTFAILRSGYGNLISQKDIEFDTYYNEAKKTSINIGTYWYSYATSIRESEEEAYACLRILNGRKLELPVFLDMEENAQFSLGSEPCNEIAIAFCETIEKNSAYKGGIYSNTNWFSNVLDKKLLNKYTIWQAQWGGNVPPCADIWQYTSTGNINGINGNVDLNLMINNLFKRTGNENVISKIQKYLNNNYRSNIAVDGIYGSKTKLALVKALQMELNIQFSRNLEVDGICGIKTKNAIVNLYYGVTGNLTRILQGLLICNGYDTGGFDGIYGIKTYNAVRKYQANNSIQIDGIAGKQTFESLCI